MKILVACEFSGIVRDAFSLKGHEVISCDLLPTEKEGRHYQGDVRDILYDGWDMLIAHPPCTYLASSGLHWNNKIPGREEKTKEAVMFVRTLLESPIEKIALENPAGRISTAIRRPDQYVQPWQFGHPEAKQTGFWLKNLPLLKPTNVLKKPESGVWENQTLKGENRLGETKDRWKKRSITYLGIAKAMADQWG